MRDDEGEVIAEWICRAQNIYAEGRALGDSWGGFVKGGFCF